MITQVYDISNGIISQKEIDESLFVTSASNEVMTQVVVATRNNSRQGSACAKTRAEVSYSTHKPWRQKGTGRARAGMRKSPIWVKGGVIFPPRPRNFSTKLPKKVRETALKTALCMKFKEEDIFLVENFRYSDIRTKEILQVFNKMPFLKPEGKKTLIVYDESNGSLDLALRNVGKFTTVPWHAVCTFDIVRHSKILITMEAFSNLEKRLENVKE